MHFPNRVCQFRIVSILLMLNLCAYAACRHVAFTVSPDIPSAVVQLLCFCAIWTFINAFHFISDNYSNFAECINRRRSVATFVCTWPPTPTPTPGLNTIYHISHSLLQTHSEPISLCHSFSVLSFCFFEWIFWWLKSVSSNSLSS